MRSTVTKMQLMIFFFSPLICSLLIQFNFAHLSFDRNNFYVKEIRTGIFDDCSFNKITFLICSTQCLQLSERINQQSE